MADAHKNLSYSTVATAPSPASSGLSLVVATGDGARFPAAPFNAVVWATGANPLPTNAEIVRVTVLVGDTLTLLRAKESAAGGPAARTIVVGDQIAATVTNKTLTDIEGLGAVDFSPAEDVYVAAHSSVIALGGVFTAAAGTVVALGAGSVLSVQP